MTPPLSSRQILAALSHASLTDLLVGSYALALAPIVEIGLRTGGVRRTAGILKVRLLFEGPTGIAVRRRSDLPLSPRERRRLTIAWRILDIGPFDGTCLRRAIVGARLLRRREHAVRIGVRKTSDGFKAHAWLEIDGISLDPDGPGEFVAQWQSASAS